MAGARDGGEKTRPIYLDHNATTPLDPAVFAAMTPYFLERFGNPSSVEHGYGSEAAQAVERARAQVAALLGARDGEIVFTGSCTEANNLAILGAARAEPERRHFVTTAIEHPAVTEPFRALSAEGARVTYLPVNSDGLVDPDDVRRAIEPDTLLVSVMAANNEVGTLQPLKAIGAICAERRVLFHSDLAQAAAYVPIDVERIGLHLASVSAHKAYGPKGVGALYVRSRRPKARLAPIIHGGGQEKGLRPGTLAVPLIVGMGEAFSLASIRMQADAGRLSRMCVAFREAFLHRVPGSTSNGHPEQRLPHSISFSVPGLEPLALMRVLRDELCFSASSACATGLMRTSPVLVAMFGDGWRARNAFRIAPGRFTADEDWAHALESLVQSSSLLTREAA